jgi:hypothetical protein
MYRVCGAGSGWVMHGIERGKRLEDSIDFLRFTLFYINALGIMPIVLCLQKRRNAAMIDKPVKSSIL